MPKTPVRWNSVISVRVSDSTKIAYQKKSQKDQKTISELVRAYLEEIVENWK